MNISLSKTAAILLLATAILWLSSCNKDLSQNSTTYGNSSMMVMMEELQPPMQYFYVSALEESTIEAEGGVQLRIPKKAFLFPNGQPVTGGSITLEVQELLDPGSMLAADKPTTSGGRILSSGGQVYFNARQSGQELRLAPGKEIDFKVPAPNPDPNMQLFAGSSDSAGFDWQPVSNPVTISDTTSGSTNDTTGTGGDTTGTGSSSGWGRYSDSLQYYEFSIRQMFRWINCDYFWGTSGPTTGFEVCLPEEFDGQNSRVYVYIPSINSVVRTYFDYQKGVFTVGSGYYLPVGLDVVFVAVSYKDGKPYYSIQSATIVQGHKEKMIMTEVDKQKLAQFLQSL